VLSGINSNQNSDSTAIDRTIFNNNGVKHTGTGVKPYANPNLASLCPVPVPPATAPTDGNGTVVCTADTVAYVAINPNAEYITAAAGTLPTSERNTEPIRPINNFDATALKRFSFGESRSVEFSCGAYNVLNHPQHIAGTIDNVSNPGFTATTGMQVASGAGFNKPGEFFTANARTLQLALKLNF